MNPYQVMGVIACCVSVFAGVVTFLTVQGVPLLLAFLGVYLFAVWCMLGMQRRARESYGCDEHPRRRHREPPVRQARSMDEPVVVSIAPSGTAVLHEPVVESRVRHGPAGATDPGDRTSIARRSIARRSIVRKETFRA